MFSLVLTTSEEGTKNEECSYLAEKLITLNYLSFRNHKYAHIRSRGKEKKD